MSNESQERLHRVLEGNNLIMAKPGETENIYLGSTRKVRLASSKRDKRYEDVLDSVLDSVNNDSTVMLTRNPTANAKEVAGRVPNRGTKVLTNIPDMKTGQPSTVVLSYQDLQLDKQKLAESDNEHDKILVRLAERIEGMFKEQEDEALLMLSYLCRGLLGIV